jgi:hypothetical protein
VRRRVFTSRLLSLLTVSAGLGCRSAQPTLVETDLVPDSEPTTAPAAEKVHVVAAPTPAPIESVQTEMVDEPAPAPPAEPFAGQTNVTVAELFAELEAVASELEVHDNVQHDYGVFVETFELEDTPELYRDYVRVKLAFEATRDGGLWNLRWDITNEKPNSEQIWAQWAKLDAATELEGSATATAECDELSALFAFVARGLGVDRIGLFWPTWNHVVAVWTVDGRDDSPVRVVVPTSQIFLGARDTLGTDGFNPWKQKTIFTYKRRDVRKSHRVPVKLARFFVRRAREHAHRPQSQLQTLRNDRSALLGGS